VKILNLYAGVGGNRKHWKNCEVTAVEFREDIAIAYADMYPDDTVIIGDANKYLEENYKEFDFIWSSPPCQTHSRMRHNLGVKGKGFAPQLPDMSLYSQIVFLQHNALPYQRWVVENVNPYYEPLIPAPLIQRHRYWSNFKISDKRFDSDRLRSAQIKELQEHHGIDLSKYKIKEKRQVLRNCVHPNMGLHVMNELFYHFAHVQAIEENEQREINNK